MLLLSPNVLNRILWYYIHLWQKAPLKCCHCTAPSWGASWDFLKCSLFLQYILSYIVTKHGFIVDSWRVAEGISCQTQSSLPSSYASSHCLGHVQTFCGLKLILLTLQMPHTHIRVCSNTNMENHARIYTCEMKKVQLKKTPYTAQDLGHWLSNSCARFWYAPWLLFAQNFIMCQKWTI